MTERISCSDTVARYLEEKAPLIQLFLSEDGRISRANRFAEAFSGRSLEGSEFKDLVVVFSGELDLDRLMSDLGEEHLLSVKREGRDPESIYFSFIRFEKGILALGRLDVDEIEQMRREVLELNTELNNLTRQLHQKNAQLRLLNDQKNQFLGMAAHDLRKPIGLITSYTEFLIDEASQVLDEEQREFLKTVHSSAFSMKRLVDDFLDVSAIEAGKFNVDLQPADIREVLRDSLRLAGILADRKGVSIQLSETGSPRRIMMDPPKIEQAVTNLVSNAVEHSEPGTSVTVILSHNEESVEVAVSDRGPGIPAEEIRNLFQAFERTSVKKGGKVKSTGLGLAITRKIIEAHGGAISVESEVGKGAFFYFTLPGDGGVS